MIKTLEACLAELQRAAPDPPTRQLPDLVHHGSRSQALALRPVFLLSGSDLGVAWGRRPRIRTGAGLLQLGWYGALRDMEDLEGSIRGEFRMGSLVCLNIRFLFAMNAGTLTER